MAQRDSGGLPSEYQQVEYVYTSTNLENRGAIRTNTKLQSGSVRMLAKYYCSSHGAYGVYVAGALNNIGKNVLGWSYKTDWSNYAATYNGATVELGSVASTQYKVIEAELSATPSENGYSVTSSFTMDGVTTQNTYSDVALGNFTVPQLCAFGYNSGSATLVGRIYYFTVYNNGEKILDLLPCYRKSDSVVGMYDLVNRVFYENVDSGRVLQKGPDV